MPLKPIINALGTGQYYQGTKVVIRLVNRGCTNRPFFHIIAQEYFRIAKSHPIEQLGSIDPLYNEHGEKLVALNVERITYWMSEGADLTDPVKNILGLAGILPITPETYIKAWRTRKARAARLAEQLEKAKQAEEAEQAKESQSSA